MTEKQIIELIECKLASYNFVPVGSIFAFPSEKIPQGFLPCEGQELSCSQYPELFRLIGTTFGGANKTFCLPDLQGQFIRGLDREGNTDIQEDGNARSLGDLQQDAIQGHKHEEGTASTDGYHRHEYYDTSDTLYYGKNTILDNERVSMWQNSSSGATNHTNYDGTHSHKFTIGSVCNDTFGAVRVASETRPKNMALIFCIKVG